MAKLMSSDADEASQRDIIALYESLNPAKRSLLPLEYQAILRQKGIVLPEGTNKNLRSLQGAPRPQSGGPMKNINA